jgi:protein TonB
MNRIINVQLPKAIDYGAAELKDWISKYTLRGVLASIALTIVLFLFVIISSMMQHQVFFAPITDIRSVDITTTLAADSQDTAEETLNEQPPEIVQVNTGPAARAGNPVAVPDSEVAPDMQEFAAEDVMDRASAEGGSGEDMGDFAGNIDMNPVEVEEKLEDLPSFEDFIPVEKDPAPASLSDLMKLIVYPEIAKRTGIEGIVTVGVLVDANGKAIKTRILHSENTNLNQAAIDAIMKYDAWIPAIQNGSPVACWLTIPINFRLN